MRNQNFFWNRHVMMAGLALAVSASPALADCSLPVGPVNTSNSNNVVGNGDPNSCSENALNQAIAKGGVITFNCGSSPYTLTLTSTKTITQDTVIDGGNLITLSGGNIVRILSIVTGNFLASSPTLTVQNITLANGYGPNNPDPGTPAGGGAIYRDGGTLNVINSKFSNNAGPASGQDAAGGAIYSIGTAPTTIVGSDFEGNQASNGGALGNLGSSLTLVNTTVTGNQATGHGGNPGNGGNGGGVYMDGVNITLNMCGTHVDKNQGNAFGGGLFFVDNALVGHTTIDQSTFNGNSTAFAGGLYLQGATGTLTNISIVSNQVQRIDGIGPFATNSFLNEDSLGNLIGDIIGQ